MFSDGHLTLGSKQPPQAISTLQETHAPKSLPLNFHRQLTKFFETCGIKLHDGKPVKVVASDIVSTLSICFITII